LQTILKYNRKKLFWPN